MSTPLRAVIHNGKIEPVQPVNLPEGTHVLVTPAPDGGVDNAGREPSEQRKLGTLRGTVKFVAPDFDAPLNDFEDYTA